MEKSHQLNTSAQLVTQYDEVLYVAVKLVYLLVPMGTLNLCGVYNSYTESTSPRSWQGEY